MKLKTWQKWGITFGVIHILVYLIFFYLCRKEIIYPDMSIYLLCLDLPATIILLGIAYIENLIKSLVGFPSYHLQKYLRLDYLFFLGTLVYVMIGAIAGIITNKIKKSKNLQVFGNILGILGIFFIVLIFNPKILSEWGIFITDWAFFIIPLGIIFIVISILSNNYVVENIMGKRIKNKEKP